MLEDGYVLLLAFGLMGLAAGGAFLIRRSALSKAQQPCQRERLERRPSDILAERMAAVRRTQQSVSPEDGRQATRRQGLGVRRKASGGEGNSKGVRTFGEGGGIRPLSRASFIGMDDSIGAPSSPPREDSPLLGKRNEKPPVSSKAAILSLAYGGGDEGEHKDKKEEVLVNWGDDQVPDGSDYGDSEAGSRRTTASAVPTTLSQADEALLGTFIEVLAEGLPIKIHRSSRKKTKKTTLWLKGADTLVWASKRAIGPKQWHKLNLHTVTRVQAGKIGADSLVIGSGESADEDACFSLSFPSVSIGFEAESELERDALVQGFAMLVEDLKVVADERRFRDAEKGVVRDI